MAPPTDLPARRDWAVTIVGSGVAGCATAVALARKGITDVCLVEPSRPPGAGVGETIPPDTRLVLAKLGLWERFVQESHAPCLGSCSSWGSDTLGYNDFVLNPYGAGWHLDRDRFDAFLRREAVETAATAVVGASLVGCQPLGARGFRLHFRSPQGESMTTMSRFVVDATGTRSAMARRLGARPMYLDRLVFAYGFFADVGSRSRSTLTMLEAVDDGWWYSARLPDDRVAVAFATDATVIARGKLHQRTRWFAKLLRTRHVAPRLDGCRLGADKLLIRHAPSFLLDSVGGAGWLAVGDAACCLDPLASQGIHKALSDGLRAEEVITAWLGSRRDTTDAYRATMAKQFDEYIVNRNYFYRLETRWQDSPFWRHRHERAALREQPLTTIRSGNP